MKEETSRTYYQAISLGIIAGMRAASAPAVAAHMLSNDSSESLSGSSLKFMQNPNVAAGLKVCALAELAGDKLAFAPARIEPAGLAGRLVSGGLSGAAICKAKNNKAFIGAVLGSVTALASSFAFYYLRRYVGKKMGVYDPLLGAAEDILVITTGIALVKTTK